MGSIEVQYHCIWMCKTCQGSQRVEQAHGLSWIIISRMLCFPMEEWDEMGEQSFYWKAEKCFKMATLTKPVIVNQIIMG